MSRTVKIILGVLIYPYGLYLIYKHYFGKKGQGLNKIEKGYDKLNDLYQDKNIYSDFYELVLSNKINEVESHLSKGVIIPLHKLFQEITKNQNRDGKNKLKQVTDMSINHSINKSLTSDLILYDDKLILKTNTIHPIGSMVKNVHGIDEIELYYKKISSIQFRGGTSVLPGKMTFIFPGKTEYEKKNNTGFDVSKGGSDPYILYFFEESNSLMKEIKDFINKKSNQ